MKHIFKQYGDKIITKPQPYVNDIVDINIIFLAQGQIWMGIVSRLRLWDDESL